MWWAGDGAVEVMGDDITLGFILFDMFDDLTLRLTYHSKVDCILRGKSKVSSANGLLAPIPVLGMVQRAWTSPCPKPLMPW